MTLLEKTEIVGAATAAWDAASGTLTLTAPAEAVGAGVRLTCEGSARDWSAAACLAFTLRANGAHRLRIDIAHGQGVWTLYVIPRPGLTSRVVIPVADLRERPHNRGETGYSRFGGGPVPVDLGDVRSVTLAFSQAAPEEKIVTLSDFGPRPEALSPAVRDPRVVVDEWGQWIGERGTPRSPEQIRAAWDAEPTTFDGFPGQTDDTGAFTMRGKAAEGTGFFRVGQVDGRWLLLDPEGYPFFSIGCNCVTPGSPGPASGGGREALFADRADAATRHADGSRWADFHERNLRRRYAAYGDDWPAGWAEQGRARLRRWGFNTIGNWSHPALPHMRLLPTATNIAALAPLCGHLPDVFAPGFGDRVRALVAPEITPYIGNPSLIGYFLGNEPIWTFGGHRNPFNDVFTSPEHPHTRERAIAWVRQTYEGDLARVNAAWGTALTAWDDLTRGGDALPDVRLGTEELKRDADAFLGEVLATFYDICCREIRAIDPDHLLLGGRFYTPEMAEPYVRACRAFDVYSFNSYAWDLPKAAIERVTALSGLPVLIGEFHYGVEGRGLTASLIGVRSQHERGLAYRHYLESAAALPQVVGAHWFQWVDQPATGRFDGESYNIGLVDVTDIPYGEFLASVQEAHHRLPEICFGEKPPYTYPGKRPSAW